MYVLRNAAKNLLRNKGRNILIGTIILVMLIAAAVSVIINTTTAKIIENYKTNFGSEIFINPDPDLIQKKLKEGVSGDLVPGITYEQKLSFGESDYLKEMKYTAIIYSKAVDIKAVGESDTGDGEATYVQGSDTNVKLMGFSSNQELEEFKNGSRKVTDGTMPQAENEAIISEDLAKQNNLKTGDTIEFDNTEFGIKSTLKLVISGIYYDSTENYSAGIMLPSFNRRNEIITTASVLMDFSNTVKQDSADAAYLLELEATYILKNPDDLEAFAEELYGKGLAEVYSVSADTASYNNIVKPVESVSGFATMFLVIVLIIGGVIITFLSALTIRERKYEIGVLRAMGMKRFTVARGLIYESVILVALCLVLGLGIGSALSAPISDIMIERQISATQTESNDSNIAIAGTSEMDDQEPLRTLNATLTWDAALQITIIALFIAMLSSAVGLVYILRYEPMKILSERD